MFLSPKAIELVAPHCDIVERLDAIPPSARVRGAYLRTIEKQIEQRGLIAAYRDYFPEKQRWSFGWHSVKIYLVHLACAGALVASPREVHAGMHEISRANAVDFSKSLLGRALIRFLARDPVRLSEQALAARRQTINYGHWELVRRGEREIEMVYQNEYTWIESTIAGSAQGAFESCDIQATLETRLIDRFNGSTLIRW